MVRMSKQGTLSNDKKVCYACGTDKSIHITTGAQNWYHNRDEEDNMLCHNCDNKYVRNPVTSRRWKGHNLKFKGRDMFLKIKPRKGICQMCGKSVHTGEIKRTHMHHLKYDESDPLAFTIELCHRCHFGEHKKLGTFNHKS